MSATLKGSNINPTLTASMIHMDDFPWRCRLLLSPSPAGTRSPIPDLRYTIYYSEEIMLRPIFKIFLLMAVTFATGWLSLSHAQRTTPTLSGDYDLYVMLGAAPTNP